MSVPLPKLHFRFKDGQSAVDVINGLTLSNGTPSIVADGLDCDSDDFTLDAESFGFDPARGTFYVRAYYDAGAAAQVLYEVYGTATGLDRIRAGSTGANTVVTFVGQRSSVQWNIASSDVGTATEFVSVGAYAVNDIAHYIGGAQIGTDATAAIPITSDHVLHVGNWGDSASRPLDGKIAELAYWNTRLDNTTLDGLSDGTLLIPLPSAGGSGMGFMTKFGFR